MTALPPDWLTQNRIDAEYKQYVVLAYLQNVQRRFEASCLYPDLPDLQRHYDSTLHFRQGMGTLRAAFPRRITGIGGPPPRIQYQADQPDDPLLAEVDTLVDFALPRFQEALTAGHQRWADLVATVSLEPVGMLPLHRQEGYIFFHCHTTADLSIYQYRLMLYDHWAPGGRLVHWQLRDRLRRPSGTSFEQLKLGLINRYELPNPATFRLESQHPVPEQETLLPIAQQLLNTALG